MICRAISRVIMKDDYDESVPTGEQVWPPEIKRPSDELENCVDRNKARTPMIALGLASLSVVSALYARSGTLLPIGPFNAILVFTCLVGGIVALILGIATVSSTNGRIAIVVSIVAGVLHFSNFCRMIGAIGNI